MEPVQRIKKKGKERLSYAGEGEENNKYYGTILTLYESFYHRFVFFVMLICTFNNQSYPTFFSTGLKKIMILTRIEKRTKHGGKKNKQQQQQQRKKEDKLTTAKT